MGADLCSYIVFGPINLSINKRTTTKAEKTVKQFISDCIAYLDKEKMCVQDGANEVYYEDHDIAWVHEYQDEPMRLVNELFEVWSGSKGRDTNFRYCPYDNKKKVVVAGDMTWGDEPDGFGYKTFKRAEQAGLFEVYKLE